MSTAYYAYIKISPENKKKLIDIINNDDMLELDNIINSDPLFNKKDIDIEFQIPVGHRAGGWKFSWSPYNKYLKSLTREAIIDFVHRDDVVIYNEYREILNKDEFLDMAFSWGKDDGWDSNTYRKEHPEETHFSLTDYQKEVCKFLGYNIHFDNLYQADFYSDGLRWTILR